MYRVEELRGEMMAERREMVEYWFSQFYGLVKQPINFQLCNVWIKGSDDDILVVYAETKQCKIQFKKTLYHA